jgi:hypothetical protein
MLITEEGNPEEACKVPEEVREEYLRKPGRNI